MTRRYWLMVAGCLAIAVALLDGDTARAAEGMRCKQRLVSRGDPQYVVQERCGPPDAVNQRVEWRKIRDSILVPCGNSMCAREIEHAVQVQIEEWTYDFGKQRFIQFVNFINGRVDNIVSGTYGYKDI